MRDKSVPPLLTDDQKQLINHLVDPDLRNGSDHNVDAVPAGSD